MHALISALFEIVAVGVPEESAVIFISGGIGCFPLVMQVRLKRQSRRRARKEQECMTYKHMYMSVQQGSEKETELDGPKGNATI